MAQTHKNLGRSKPSAATNTDIYTVGGATTTQLYCIVICNTGATATTIRLYHVQSGGSAGTDNALYYDLQIPGRDTFVANIAEVMATGDKITVYSDNGNATFRLSGMEIT